MAWVPTAGEGYTDKDCRWRGHSAHLYYRTSPLYDWIVGAGQRWGVEIKAIDFASESYRSAFCVAATDQRLLEQEARPIVLATDDLMGRSPNFAETHQLGSSTFIPVIVTTSTLYTLRYEPTDVPLETGSFDKVNHKEIELIPWVRFHKTFTALPGSVARTVFVVNSGALPSFLDAISQAQGLG